MAGPSRAWRPAVALAAVALAAGSAPAQSSGHTQEIRDSLVLRLAAYRAPCPDPVPAEWSLADGTFGRPPRCHLIEAAARLVRDQLRGRRMAPVPEADPWRPLCVRLYELDSGLLLGHPPEWMVVFDLAPGLTAEVMIDRRSGAPVFALLGDGTRLLGRPCTTTP